jgi:hypothetical protein
MRKTKPFRPPEKAKYPKIPADRPLRLCYKDGMPDNRAILMTTRAVISARVLALAGLASVGRPRARSWTTVAWMLEPSESQ